MPRTVVTDADMLFGGTTRALFIFLDYAAVLRLHWSQRILTELSAALVKQGRQPDVAAAEANEKRMNDSVEHALLDQAQVDRHEAAMKAYVNDEGDAHVAACAYELVSGGYYPGRRALVLSTRNVNDFKVAALATLGITVQHPDDLLMTLPLDQVAAALRDWRSTMKGPPDPETLLVRLEKDGTFMTAQALRAGVAAGSFEL